MALDQKFLEAFKNFDLVIERADELNKIIVNWSDWQKFNPQKTLLVLPGNGASIVRSYLPKAWLDNWQWVSIHAKRYWVPGHDPQVIVNRINDNKMLLGFDDIVIIDDVISSGQTCRNLRIKNLPWIPKAKWHTVTWLMQKSANTKGFISVFYAKDFGTKTRKAPINSLSTLLSDEQIALSYSARNFPDQQIEFINLLSAIKKG